MTWLAAVAVLLLGARLQPQPMRSLVPADSARPVRAAADRLRTSEFARMLGRRRRRREIESVWPDAVELLVHALEAGLTPRQAVTHLATVAPTPVRTAFASVVHRTERGQPFADALQALPDELGTFTSGLVDVVATSERYGLPLAPVLDQLARDARDARRRLDQAAARRLPVRLSFPLVTCTLPSFVLLAIAPAVIAALSSLGGTAW
jgi:tight adherence protein C